VAPVWGGMKDGFIRLQGLADNLPTELVEAVKTRQEEIRADKFHPFTAPIKSNDGEEVLGSGSLTDAQLAAMNYYVEGVVGKVPVGGK
jgi:simple sugar transport system substrate-binding protein